MIYGAHTHKYALGLILFALLGSMNAYSKKKRAVEPSTAWEVTEPLGIKEVSTIDTMIEGYAQKSVPADLYLVNATVGNYGGACRDMDFARQNTMSDFYFRDALSMWLPSQLTHKFYNTRIPMSLVSYNTGGGKEDKQDRLAVDFSGNVNSRLQFGAMLDYIYSKGSYSYQANKDLAWGLSSSYIGHRYEYQTFYNHHNGMWQDNGGITDPLYITDPAALQGGQTSINAKSIPTRLTSARTRMKGQEFYLNQRYKFGFWRVTPPADTVPGDTVEHKVYVPVTSVIWTFDYTDASHAFFNNSPTEADDYWGRNFVTTGPSANPTSYWGITNTVGLALLEGFNKYAKAGLAAYITHKVRHYNQMNDPMVNAVERPEILTPYPYVEAIAPKATQHLLWVGGQLAKQTGSLLRFVANGKVGLIGDAAGEIDLNGRIVASFPLRSDSMHIGASASFTNLTAPYLMQNYVSNYFIWHNDFSKTRDIRVGAYVDVPRWGSRVSATLSNTQNHIYFDGNGMPVQCGSSVQALNLKLDQKLHAGILHWDNRFMVQKSTNSAVMPVPLFAAYSNLYLLFRIAKVLHVQFGVDCDYYTKYYAPVYQPATMAFCHQNVEKVGNYPFMNLYANLKLKKARFYVMLSHVNQGLTGRNYFSMPNYPLNPRRFQMGVSVDFAN